MKDHIENPISFTYVDEDQLHVFVSSPDNTRILGVMELNTAQLIREAARRGAAAPIQPRGGV